MEAHPSLAQKKRDDSEEAQAAYRQAQQVIQGLRAQANAGEIVLAYLDEAGFAQAHPNRNAWTPKGKRHLIEATHGKRLNVMAAMLSDGGIFSAKYWEKTTANVFAGFLGLLQKHVGKPLTVILDNASFHKAKEIQPVIDFLKAERDVTLYFLPPYSPELNRIERLWHKIKHTWMAAKHRDPGTLETDIKEIMDNFGSIYKFAF